MTLRPAVRRLVLMKKGHAEGPVLARRPAHLGRDRHAADRFRRPGSRRAVCRTRTSNPGDTWKAADAAVAELTDLEKVEKGELTCTLEKIEVVGPRTVAQVTFTGTLHGDQRGRADAAEA